MTFTKLPETTTHLRRISPDNESLLLEPSGGTETFFSARKLFTGFLDGNFKNYGTAIPSEPTGRIIPVVYEQTTNGNLQTMLGSFGSTENLSWKSQDPLIQFIRRFKIWLHPGKWATLFPFLVGNECFVAIVRQRRGELRANIRRSEYSPVFYAKYRHRFVLPQPLLQPKS